MGLPNHGANPLRLYESYGMIPPEKIYDFSENVNPIGPPPAIIENWPRYLDYVTHYPDPLGEPFFSRVASFHRVERNNIVLGNGASELFAVLARRYIGKRVIIVHPTFSEYEATLLAAGAELVDIIVEDVASWKLPTDTIKKEMKNASALYLCTPNNPTGVLPNLDVLNDLITYGRDVDCELVLDEAFIDWVDERLSNIPLISSNPHVIVVRSMTKLYAIPGIRLGYLVADAKICMELQSQMPHWHINGLAALIGKECLDSDDYAREAVQLAKQRREKFSELLAQYGCNVTSSVTNYVAFRLPKIAFSQLFFRFCLERGIVLRHSENFKGMDGHWFRVGMKEDADMAVFEKVLSDWFVNSK